MLNFFSKARWFVAAFLLGITALFVLQQASLGQEKEAPAKESQEKKLHWQFSRSTNAIMVYRARVPGGWFVAIGQDGRDHAEAQGAFFYPDPNHEWDGGNI